MLRIVFILFTLLCVLFLVFNASQTSVNYSLPSYLKEDKISEAHQTEIDVQIHSLHKPDSMEIVNLKNDYSSIWAHLNNVYATNNVEAGKRYFSESWFNHLALRHDEELTFGLARKDLYHHLHVINWAWDGLVCCAVDSNVVLHYIHPDGSIDSSRTSVGMVLLYQGSNWRLDAMRVLADK